MPELPSPAATSLIQPWKRSVMELFDEALLLLLGKADRNKRLACTCFSAFQIVEGPFRVRWSA